MLFNPSFQNEGSSFKEQTSYGCYYIGSNLLIVAIKRL